MLPPALLLLLLLLLLLPAAAPGHRTPGRRRRYLVFPSGSSLQLVFELAIPTAHPRPYTMAWTAGLAWELPSDAKVLLEKLKRRPSTEAPPPPPPTKPPHYHYYVPLAHSAADSKGYYVPPPRPRLRPAPYRGYSGYSHPVEVRLHRRHRRDALLKLEPLLLAAGVGGRSCLLRALCEAGRPAAGGRRGGFLAELMRTLFTLPPAVESEEAEQCGGGEGHSDVLQQFDRARDAAGDCSQLYPDCSVSLLFA